MPDFIDDMLESALAALGDDATYTPQGGQAFTLRVMPAQEDDVGNLGQTRIKSDTTLLECRVSDLASPQKGDGIVFRGQSFTLKSQPRRIDDERLLWLLECQAA